MNRTIKAVAHAGQILLALLLVTWLARGLSAAEAPLPKDPAGGSGSQRLREGVRLTEVTGRFEFTGDRITFYPASGKESYRVLENLAAERISVILTDSAAKPTWLVTGIMTEFRGSNYLQVSKAVIRLDQLETSSRPGQK